MTDSPIAVRLASASTHSSLNTAINSTLKRKRKPAGTPDPDAEVIALSPQTLMESDRYVCEICNQGFQRDQNLQMHRRRHKVPWKLLKRLDPVAHKRVYICPEPSCLHHHPCHALGDLVGIKKHYRRKHSSMKQWACERCSKAYAVQSDYKAHMKTCGTRGHCCDCGRVYSRVESFIEHQDTCPSARKNKGSASTGLDGASVVLSSLAEPAAAANAITPTTASLFSGCVVKELQYVDHHINAATSHFHSPHKAELQLLPSSKLRSNQLESSEGSVTLGKDMASAACMNCTTSGRTCWSPCSRKVDDDKLAHEGGDGLIRRLQARGASSPSVDAPWKLQLSIGLSDKGAGAYSENQESMESSRGVKANQEENSLRGVIMRPWLHWSALPGEGITQRTDHTCHDHNSMDTPKSYSSLCSTTDAKQGIASSKDGLQESITRLISASNQRQSTERGASLAGSIEETDRASEVLHYTETPSFLLGTNGEDLSPCLEMKAPTSDMRAALEALVKEASEKLKRASEEKLEAEKAWIEARREREQAEEERAKVQRIAEYHRMVALGDKRPERLGAKLGEPTCINSNTRRFSPSFNFIAANCHGLASSLQIMQLQEASVISGAPGSLITCPSCHHTSQILYPPPNYRALFGASPLELAAPPCSTVLTTTSNFILPSSPTRLST